MVEPGNRYAKCRKPDTKVLMLQEAVGVKRPE